MIVARSNFRNLHICMHIYIYISYVYIYINIYTYIYICISQTIKLLWKQKENVNIKTSYIAKVNNMVAKARCKISPKLTIKT